ncbi:MAG: hypothetical protein M3Q33_05115 [Acidobacteriota bacterium]|nr:hypothetical protein [Acidobacteriota bacterium]
MTETEKMQQLHLLAAQGAKLSAEDEAKLKSWYEKLDREESVINRNNRQIDTAQLRQKIEKTTKQIGSLSNEITVLLTQNEQIRLENMELRQQLESRLVEQTA